MYLMFLIIQNEDADILTRRLNNAVQDRCSGPCSRPRHAAAWRSRKRAPAGWVAVEATSRPRQFGYETPQLRLERRLHAGSPYRSNDLVSAGPEPPLSCDLRLNHAGNSLGRSPPGTTPEPTGPIPRGTLRTRSASCQMSSYCCRVIGMTICLAPRGACGEGVFRSRFTCRVFGRASILASPSLVRRRMTKMPPAGYPAFLQYLQSGRVSGVAIGTGKRSENRRHRQKSVLYIGNMFLYSLIVHIPHRRRQIVDVSDPFNIDCR